ncbi:MAG TPA: tripartite tricarboxylate transporter TctB family protein [Pseudonocardia sp.]|uniref:tripartite tricarboxylate transporter TctB family protein n=1 Tax=Pseudonocardia sp. TaxID=60912 RepID=UPI002CFFDFB2|nr:tripartite tricarboxylate transporter TctB family protein [Pseudonocardia sp.]HTF53098.1 tripartite tricarboxylate transporter TctB family protein [Pseudonocardia sp.]
MDRSSAAPERGAAERGLERGLAEHRPAGRWPRGQLHRIGPLVVLGVGVSALVGAAGLSLGELTAPGAGLWPFIVALLLTGTGAVLVVADDPADYQPWTRGTARIAGGLVGLGVFVAAFGAVGFLLPSFLMLLLWLRVFGGERWPWAVGLALAGSVGMYLLFVTALGVPFPEDVLLIFSRG